MMKSGGLAIVVGCWKQNPRNSPTTAFFWWGFAKCSNLCAEDAIPYWDRWVSNMQSSLPIGQMVGFFGAGYVPLGTTPVRLVDDGHHDDSSGDEADTTLASYNNGGNTLSFLPFLFISHKISRIRRWTSLNHGRLTPLCAVSESAMEATSQLTRMGRPARGVVGAHASLSESWRW